MVSCETQTIDSKQMFQFIVCHGERTDKVPKYVQLYKRNDDPGLTPEGQTQSTETAEWLGAVIKKKEGELM